jgi:pilus assembly protein Flp/PilA
MLSWSSQTGQNEVSNLPEGSFRPKNSKREKIMNKIRQMICNFVKSEDGPTAVEYAVMLALIIVVCITAITTLGGNTNATFNSVSNALTTSSS